MARARPRRGALGLRGRIVGAVLVVTVATLAVAAVTLFGPLENSLQNVAHATFVNDLKNVQRRFFNKINFTYLPLAGQNMANALTPGQPGYSALLHEYDLGAEALGSVQTGLQRLSSRIGGAESVRIVLDNYTAPLQGASPDSDSGTYADAITAYEKHKTKGVFGYQTIQGTDNVTAAFPLGRSNYVLTVRKPIDEVRPAVDAVRKAFGYAVIAGLVLSILLGVPLAGRLVRRLRRLRQVALQLAAGGLAVQVPDDRARDEVGDLARSFSVMQERLAPEQARRAFVATASHELRTPLTSLEGMLELLDDDLQQTQPDLTDARELLSSARAQSRRLGRLAADLLDLSRIDAEVTLRSEPIELGELSRAVLAEFDLGVSARGVSTGLEGAEAPVWALGDPGSIARILRILLDNALRVSSAGTEVTVEVSALRSPTMSVRDHGPGVQESERELIFERFHRGKNTAGDAGFGLGLAIGRELAERMGGALVLDPPDDGGARFTLTLPAARAAEEDPLLIV